MTIAPERTRKTSASEDAAARAGSDALVLDAAMKQALATTRSLGRAGLGVALADCAPGGTLGTVPAFRSRWSVSRGVLPDFNLDPDAYAAGVLELVKAQKTRAVVPLSDQSIASLRPWREKVEAHAPLALAADAALDIASDKSKTLVLASQLGLSAPRTVQARTEQEVLDALDEVGFPAVLKPTVPWSRERGGPRSFPRDVLDKSEALAVFASLQRAGAGVLVQELARGRREAVCLFRAGGTLRAEFALTYLRTTPVLGGASVLRQSIPMAEDVRWAAFALVDAIGLDGYSEVEFRRDSSGRPLLMEVNARLSGSLELAVRAGVDFPLMLWKWACGLPVDKVGGYRHGLRSRWLPGECSWLLENLRRPGRPDSVPRGRAVARFLAEFARRDAYDFLDWRDMRPAFSEMARLVDKWALHRGRPRTVKLRGTFGELPSSTTGELGGER